MRKTTAVKKTLTVLSLFDSKYQCSKRRGGGWDHRGFERCKKLDQAVLGKVTLVLWLTKVARMMRITRVYRAALSCTALYWALVSCSRLHWAALYCRACSCEVKIPNQYSGVILWCLFMYRIDP